MPRFDANLTMLFTELPFLDRFAAARKAGFAAVEFLFPYDYDVGEIAKRLDDNGLQVVLHNLPAGDWAGGERGVALMPDRVAEFREGVASAIAYADRLGCRQVNCLVGKAPPGVDGRRCEDVLVANLAFAADALARAGVRLLLEAVNRIDVPGFHLTRTEEVLDVIAATGSQNIFVQYDIYHMQIAEGDLARTIEHNLKRISHVQLADNPGRHEPGTGEINYPFLFRHLDKIGYDRWVGRNTSLPDGPRTA